MIFIDFEFNGTKEPVLNLVCAVLYNSATKERLRFWLHNSPNSQAFLKDYLSRNSKETFVSWSVVAEARSFLSLNINPYPLKWIDLFLEYKCLSNNSDDLNYGKQYQNGKVIFTRKPPKKWDAPHVKDKSIKEGFKPTYSLAEATYKLLNVIRDTDHKDAMRNLIISSPSTHTYTPTEQQNILDYCEEDVLFLPKLYVEILNIYKQRVPELVGTNVLQGMFNRGKYAALTAIREAKGHPFDYYKTKTFSRRVPEILNACRIDINSQFNSASPDKFDFPFKYDKKKKEYSWRQKETRDYLKKNFPDFIPRWEMTDGGTTGNKQLSLSLEAFEKFFPYKHDYPQNNFGAQIVRYLKLKQSLNGFNPKAEKTIWSYVGSDKMLRVYMNIFGSQTSRSQPPSTPFLLLKPAWQRSLLMPPKGYCITSIDYSSEEYLIAALFYRDSKMIQSYASGDVYLAFGKSIGLIPKDGTKETHKFERNICKSTVLGISFSMSKYGLSDKLTADLGKPFSQEEANNLIEQFNSTYEQFSLGQQEVLDRYAEDGYLELPDHWFIWGNCDNFRSVLNFPIQGLGATIMRLADQYCYERGVEVILTLHDALYLYHKVDDYKCIDIAMDAMKQAFVDCFDTDMKRNAELIRMEAYTWGPDLPENGTIKTPNNLEVDCSNIYIDERAQSEYEKFSHFFENEFDL